MVNPADGACELRNVNETDDALQGPHDEDASEEQIPLVAVRDPGKVEDGGEPPASNESTVKKLSVDFQGLTKEQLQEFVNDPFWKRLRLIFFILFWVIWAAMLAAVIIIIVVSPKCPPRPTRQFWQKPFYRLQVKSFAPASDSDPTAVGSIKGLAKKMDYLRQALGFNNFILDSLVSTETPTGCPADFKSHSNASLGSMETLKILTKLGRKKGFNFLMDFDASQADINWGHLEDESDAFISDALGELPKLASRNGGAAWYKRRLHLPSNGCPSLNLTSSAVQAKVEDALAYWLDAGLSGFVLTNVAFILPSPLDKPVTTDNWFDVNPTEMLFSNASVDFVRSIRRFINAQAEKRGRELALFVDPGSTGFPLPEARLAAYLDPTGGAHAVVSTGLGVSLSAKVPSDSRLPSMVIRDTLNKVGDRGSVIFATAWPHFRRLNESFWTALSLTLPGVPCLYYGQELGMTHVPNVNFTDGRSSNDFASETPMQWSDSPYNGGWLANKTTPLAWIGLTPRAADIERHNMRRLSSAGHRTSELQLVQVLVQLISTKESLQWGSLTFLTGTGSASASPANVIAFKRQAERFPPIVVVINGGERAATLDLSEAGSPKGTLKIMHSSVAGSESSYQVDQDYSLDQVFVPAKSILVFLGKEAEK